MPDIANNFVSGLQELWCTFTRGLIGFPSWRYLPLVFDNKTRSILRVSYNMHVDKRVCAAYCS